MEDEGEPLDRRHLPVEGEGFAPGFRRDGGDERARVGAARLGLKAHAGRPEPGEQGCAWQCGQLLDGLDPPALERRLNLRRRGEEGHGKRRQDTGLGAGRNDPDGRGDARGRLRQETGGRPRACDGEVDGKTEDREGRDEALPETGLGRGVDVGAVEVGEAGEIEADLIGCRRLDPRRDRPGGIQERCRRRALGGQVPVSDDEVRGPRPSFGRAHARPDPARPGLGRDPGHAPQRGRSRQDRDRPAAKVGIASDEGGRGEARDPGTGIARRLSHPSEGKARRPPLGGRGGRRSPTSGSPVVSRPQTSRAVFPGTRS